MKHDKYYIGLDIGADGGVVVLNYLGEVVEVFKNPDNVKEWQQRLKEYSNKHCICLTEKVHSRPTNGAKANFTFGFNKGVTLAMLQVMDIPFREITPQSWMKGYMMKKDKSESQGQWKNRLKAKAMELFQKQKVTLWNADAFLIAEYCRNNFA